jgi:hypothetical protein
MGANGRPLRPGLAHRAAAQGIAAFALVFAGCGAVFGAHAYQLVRSYRPQPVGAAEGA